jgi:hypothetical protein
MHSYCTAACWRHVSCGWLIAGRRRCLSGGLDWCIGTACWCPNSLTAAWLDILRYSDNVRGRLLSCGRGRSIVHSGPVDHGICESGRCRHKGDRIDGRASVGVSVGFGRCCCAIAIAILAVSVTAAACICSLRITLDNVVHVLISFVKVAVSELVGICHDRQSWKKERPSKF